MKQYYYHGNSDTYHPQLGLLKPGANEIPDDLVELADACVEAGLLSHSAYGHEHDAQPARPSRSSYARLDREAARAPKEPEESAEPKAPQEGFEA